MSETKKPRGRPKKVVEVAPKTVERDPDYVAPLVDSKYDEFGVCVSCKGGKEGCLHNNLSQVGQSLICVICGFKVK